MNSKTELLIWIASGLWLACFVASFIMTASTPPTGESFVRGMNRMNILLGWQLAAFVVAVTGGIFTFGRRDRISRGLKWIGFTPLIVSGLCVAIFVIFVILGMLF